MACRRVARKRRSDEADRMTPTVCQSCAACCSLIIDGELVACRHLRATDGRYQCAIYATRPAVCRDYDCTREDLPANALVRDRAQAAMRLDAGRGEKAP